LTNFTKNELKLENMKSNKCLIQLVIFLTILLFACHSNQHEFMSKENNQNLIVLVKYKTQTSKGEEAIAGLTKLLEAVKSEPNFIKITMHTDLHDHTNILLYEEWSNEAYYNGDHMKTTHIQKFMVDSRAFLAGPPEITQWKIERELIHGR